MAADKTVNFVENNGFSYKYIKVSSEKLPSFMSTRLFRKKLKTHNFSNELICEDYQGGMIIRVRTLKEDQPLRLLLNLVFYHFNCSEPTYKSQRIKLLDVIAAYNQLNVNALN